MYYSFTREKFFTTDVNIYLIEKFYYLILEIYQASITYGSVCIGDAPRYDINFQFHSSQ